MDLDHFEKRLFRALDRIEELLECRRHRPRRDICYTIAAGPKGYTTMLNLEPGESGTVIATYQDTNQNPPVSLPLTSPASATVDNPSITLTQVKDGTTDGIATWTALAAVGSTPGPFTVTSAATGPNGPIPGTYGGAIMAPGDNSVVMSSTVP